ncbi:MAG: hypothetical protein IT490_04615 [Candidatus Contendobacter sp.]|nr:hypothetical protein [Candidatus Contendobacter sp.]
MSFKVAPRRRKSWNCRSCGGPGSAASLCRANLAQGETRIFSLRNYPGGGDRVGIAVNHLTTDEHRHRGYPTEMQSVVFPAPPPAIYAEPDNRRRSFNLVAQWLFNSHSNGKTSRRVMMSAGLP